MSTEEKRHNIDAQVRAAEDSERKIQGYAAVFNKVTRLSERLHEKIMPGAFRSSIQNDVRALWGHDINQVIGRSTNGSLKLNEDDVGLRFELNLPDTVAGRDAYTLVKGGYVSGVSFGFRVKKDSWERGGDSQPHVRTLIDVELIEISPTAFPAYPETFVSARSLDSILKDKETEWAWLDNEKKPNSDVQQLRFKLDLLERSAVLDALLH